VGLASRGAVPPGVAWRLIDEEQYRAKWLPGYANYMRKVRCRLVPQVW